VDCVLCIEQKATTKGTREKPEKKKEKHILKRARRATWYD
jgi:hypothetical protein